MSDSKKSRLAAAKAAAAGRVGIEAAGAGGASVTTAGSSMTIFGISLIHIAAVVALLGVVTIAIVTRKH